MQYVAKLSFVGFPLLFRQKAKLVKVMGIFEMTQDRVECESDLHRFVWR